ncbi:MAG: hypothetical protein A4E30_01619 [Methanomassiliicoccales archaeon PtaB.Bin215]|nr:MAG: hypothetical protein A4E30_01619 [Methanomassiliicoccales archaeon PtaB.Bin215]
MARISDYAAHQTTMLLSSSVPLTLAPSPTREFAPTMVPADSTTFGPICVNSPTMLPAFSTLKKSSSTLTWARPEGAEKPVMMRHPSSITALDMWACEPMDTLFMIMELLTYV